MVGDGRYSINTREGGRLKTIEIANALLERESLDNAEVRMLMEGKQLPARVIPPPTAAAPETTQVLKPQPGPGSVPGRERPQPA